MMKAVRGDHDGLDGRARGRAVMGSLGTQARFQALPSSAPPLGKNLSKPRSWAVPHTLPGMKQPRWYVNPGVLV